MKLTEMKRSKKERTEMNKCVPYEGDSYPYGLRVRLEADELDKLGMKLPKVGEKFTLEARAVVTSVSQNSSDRGHEHRSVELVLQKIGLEKGVTSMADAVRGAVE